MRTMTSAGVLLAGLLLAACGADAPLAEPLDAPSTTATSAPAAVPDPAAKLGETDLGPVLTSADGLTLYGFTNDVDAQSTCSGACADAWPPVIVDDDWTVGPGVDVGVFATTVREDGQLQLVAGAWPLYTYGGDAAPGDANGQGSGDVWFAVDPEGGLHGADGQAADEPSGDDPYAEGEESSSAAADEATDVAVGDTDLGAALVDGEGLTLYGFTNDEDGIPTCEGDCADAWPPVTVEGDPVLAAELDAAGFDTVERPDGTHQVVAGVWPLYRFAGDSQPGDSNGQGSGDVWFVVAPDGSLVR